MLHLRIHKAPLAQQSLERWDSPGTVGYLEDGGIARGRCDSDWRLEYLEGESNGSNDLGDSIDTTLIMDETAW